MVCFNPFSTTEPIGALTDLGRTDTLYWGVGSGTGYRIQAANWALGWRNSDRDVVRFLQRKRSAGTGRTENFMWPMTARFRLQ